MKYFLSFLFNFHNTSLMIKLVHSNNFIKESGLLAIEINAYILKVLN